MKIAVFNRHFARRAGGAESYSVSLVEGLAAQHEIHVFAQVIDHVHPNVTYHKVPGPIHRPRWINQLLFATYTWWKTRSGFDAIHSHENTWHGQVQTVHVRPIRFHLFEGADGQVQGWRRLLRWLKIVTSPRLAFYVWLEAARMKPEANRTVVAVSSLLREQTLMAYPHLAYSSTNLPVILPGVGVPDASLTKEQSRAKLNLPLDEKLILFVGNDYARKGLPALLASMSILQANLDKAFQSSALAHLLVVGNTAQAPKFQLVAAELGITEHVHFVGALADMSLAYRAADMLVHPTLEDSFAMVVLEAMSYGLPVVVSSATYCGISQFLRNDMDALILNDPRNTLQIAAQINRVLQESGLRQTLSNKGLHFAAQHQWQQAVDSYSAIYAAVASSAIPPTTLLKPPST